jgi:hypothetical protein
MLLFVFYERFRLLYVAKYYTSMRRGERRKYAFAHTYLGNYDNDIADYIVGNDYLIEKSQES